MNTNKSADASPGFLPKVGATCGVTGYSWVGDITAGMEFNGGLAAPLIGGFCNNIQIRLS